MGKKCVVPLLQTAQPVMVYREEKVAADLIDTVLEAIRWSPAAANLQPWEVVVIEGDEGKRLVVESTLDPMLRHDGHGRQEWILTAPCVLVMVADQKRVRARYGPAGNQIACADAAGAVVAAILACSELGLASAVVREFDGEALREVLAIPTGLMPVAVITLGHSDRVPSLPPRMAIDRFTHRERW